MGRKHLAVALAIALAACGTRHRQESKLDMLDNELVDANSAGNMRDPAIAGALHDQIMVDPALTQQSNDDAIRPPPRPYSGAVPPDNVSVPAATPGAHSRAVGETLAPVPDAKGACPGCTARRAALTLGALAQRQADPRTRDCAGSVRYSASWATRLPAELPLYPDARVSEAAGIQDATCSVRAVTFATTAPLKTVLDWYYTRARHAGYAAEHQADGAEHVLGGNRARDQNAFALFLKSRADGGTDVDLVTNNGR